MLCHAAWHHTAPHGTTPHHTTPHASGTFANTPRAFRWPRCKEPRRSRPWWPPAGSPASQGRLRVLPAWLFGEGAAASSAPIHTQGVSYQPGICDITRQTLVKINLAMLLDRNSPRGCGGVRRLRSSLSAHQVSSVGPALGPGSERALKQRTSWRPSSLQYRRTCNYKA